MCETEVSAAWRFAAYTPDAVVNAARFVQKAARRDLAVLRALDTTLLVLVVAAILTYRGSVKTCHGVRWTVRTITRWHRERSHGRRVTTPRLAITAQPHTPPPRLQIDAQPHQPSMLVGKVLYPARERVR